MWMPMSRVTGASTTTLMLKSRRTAVIAVVKDTLSANRGSYVAIARTGGYIRSDLIYHPFVTSFASAPPPSHNCPILPMSGS